MINPILATYNRATPDQIIRGICWYMDGYNTISEIADSCSLSVGKVAAVTAHLSPRLQWTTNVRAAYFLCAGMGRRSGIMNRSYNMAMSAFLSEDPLSTLNGPKVQSFAQNLLLRDMNRVTVDVWALRAAGVPDLDIKRKGSYTKVEEAYQQAAQKLDILPAHLQAVCWIVTKESWKRGK
jgi:hypothetical protein